MAKKKDTVERMRQSCLMLSMSNEWNGCEERAELPIVFIK